MIVPEALVGRSEALAVVGKNPFVKSWHLGEYEVSGAWQGGDTGRDFGFRIGAPGAEPLEVRCTDASHWPFRWTLLSVDLPQPTGIALSPPDLLVCPLGGGVLTAEWKSGLVATLGQGARELRVEVARGIEGDDLPAPSGYLFCDEAGVVAAFERVGVGRLLVADGAPPAVRLRMAAASIVLVRWEDIRDRGGDPMQETSINEGVARTR